MTIEGERRAGLQALHDGEGDRVAEAEVLVAVAKDDAFAARIVPRVGTNRRRRRRREPSPRGLGAKPREQQRVRLGAQEGRLEHAAAQAGELCCCPQRPRVVRVRGIEHREHGARVEQDLGSGLQSLAPRYRCLSAEPGPLPSLRKLPASAKRALSRLSGAMSRAPTGRTDLATRPIAPAGIRRRPPTLTLVSCSRRKKRQIVLSDTRRRRAASAGVSHFAAILSPYQYCQSLSRPGRGGGGPPPGRSWRLPRGTARGGRSGRSSPAPALVDSRSA